MAQAIQKYWETWIGSDSRAIVHYGILGNKGEVLEFDGEEKKQDEEVKKAMVEKIKEGYLLVKEEDFLQIVIEYKIGDYPHSLDFIKEMETLLNEKLGWLGLGYCDGNSVGSGTFEIFCYVLDKNIACSYLKKILSDNNFGNYNRIY